MRLDHLNSINHNRITGLARDWAGRLMVGHFPCKEEILGSNPLRKSQPVQFQVRPYKSFIGLMFRAKKPDETPQVFDLAMSSESRRKAGSQAIWWMAWLG